nr:hypothetical protein [uncultured Allomuricauda sp.]
MSLANPFKYSTPDQIKDPNEALDLFVDVFKDFYLIESVGNTFVNGPRGSGKSMMYRIMRPDCQKVKLGSHLKELNYFAIYVPIKDKALDIEELKYLKHGENALNEHLMTTYFSIAVFKCLEEEDFSRYQDAKEEVFEFYNIAYRKAIISTGFNQDDVIELTDQHSINDVFRLIREALEDILEKFNLYLQKLSLTPDDIKYSGELCLYKNFLFPLTKKIGKFTFLPNNKPIYFLVDDANWLNYAQTRILNSWVSYRSTSIACFKITTQQNYKTYYTVTGRNKIDSPHDYHEINLMDIYTSNQSDRYKDNLKKIVEKRLLQISGIETTAEKFFPPNLSQDKKLQELKSKLENDKGYDYAYRNFRADYMLSMPNEYTYSYGGFDQLVHLSSGIIRNFIDMSFNMFDKAVRNNSELSEITHIPIKIQDEQILEYSNWFLKQIEKSIDDNGLDPLHVNSYKRLRSLISSIGKAFRLFLESEASERRKFSFYYDGNMQDEFKDVLKIGISEGYFHYSTHGSKTGLGRSHKYVMNRILSPVYKLDPFSFSGYLYLTTDNIELAMTDEKAFLSYIKKRIKADIQEEKSDQIEMDFDN